MDMTKTIKENLSLYDINNLSYLGEEVGSGTQSIAIKVNYLHNFSEKLKQPVLIITQEKEKEDFLKLLIPDQVESIVFDEDELEINEFLESLELIGINGFYMFYMEYMDPLNFSSMIQEELIGTISDDTQSYCSRTYSFEYAVEVALEVMDQELNITKEDLSEEDERFISKMETCMDELSKTMERLNISAMLDIHEGQFLEYNDKIICVDPCLFNRDYL